MIVAESLRRLCVAMQFTHEPSCFLRRLDSETEMDEAGDKLGAATDLSRCPVCHGPRFDEYRIRITLPEQRRRAVFHVTLDDERIATRFEGDE